MASNRVKIIVTSSESSIALLKYIRDNIATITRMGLTLRFEKIRKCEMDDDMVQSLKKSGITRLPAMINASGKRFIGVNNVIAELSKGVKTRQMTERVFMPDTDIQSHWQSEMYEVKDGAMVPRQDAEPDEGNNADIERRMAMAQTKGPAHRKEPGANDPKPTPKSPLGMGGGIFGDNISSPKSAEDALDEWYRGGDM